MRQDQRRGHGVGVDDPRQTHPPIGQLLNDADIGQEIETEPAVGLGDGDAEETELTHLRDDVHGKRVLVFQRGGHGDHLSSHEAAHRFDDLPPEVRVVHPPSHVARGRMWRSVHAPNVAVNLK